MDLRRYQLLSFPPFALSGQVMAAFNSSQQIRPSHLNQGSNGYCFSQASPSTPGYSTGREIFN
jgi:hypothetical protein